jgi:hypothetical protein
MKHQNDLMLRQMRMMMEHERQLGSYMNGMSEEDIQLQRALEES